MNAVFQALARGVRSQFQPLLLLLTIAPFIAGAFLAWFFVWLTWEPLTAWLGAWLGGTAWLSALRDAAGALGLELKAFAIPLLAIAVYLPTAVLFALILTTCFAMPFIVRRIADDCYADVQRRHGGSWIGSVVNSTWISLIVGVGWIVSLPLYLIAPLALLVPWLWLTFAFSRVLRYDALAEHASKAEREALIGIHKGRLFALAGILAVFNWIPFAWFALPVFSGIVFTHYCLQALREQRALDVAMP